MKSGKNIEKVIRELDLSVDINAKVDEAVLSEILKAYEKTKSTQLITIHPNIWRIIMNSIKTKKMKMAITVVVLMILLGFVPFNGTTAFGKIATKTTTTLARLKALVLGEELPEAEHKEQQIDKSVKIFTTCKVYSSPEISQLENFLNERNISFVSGDSDTVKYAVIPPDKVAALQGFLQSSDSYSIIASPKALAYVGQEAMLAIVDTVGVAITVLQDKNKHLNLDFAIHNGQDGCDIRGIKLENGEVLLISGIKSSKDKTSDDIMTTLVLQR